MKIRSKKAQEEMVGFALIVIIVAIVLLVFLAFAFTNNKKTELDSYEVESFVQSSLQYTSQCKHNFDYLDIQDLIFSCLNKQTCNNGEDSCNVLNETIKGLIDASWDVGNESIYKAYEFSIKSKDESLINLSKGNFTDTYKGTLQNFAQSGEKVDIILRIYG